MGGEHAKSFVDIAISAARADRFPVCHFVATKQYVNPWLAGKNPERRPRPLSEATTPQTLNLQPNRRSARTLSIELPG